MKYYLCTFADSWADEIDLTGFVILNDVEKDIVVATIRKEYKHGGTICFGTNEDNEYGSLYEIMDTLDFKEITPVEYNAIKKAFGTTSFGEIGPLSVCDFNEDCDDEDFEEDDEDDGEEEYNSHAMKITKFIEKEYGIEPDSFSPNSYFSSYKWKPTPNTEINIIIAEYSEDDEEEIEISLNFKSKTVKYEFFKVEDIWSNPESYLRPVMKNLIEQAKKY